MGISHLPRAFSAAAFLLLVAGCAGSQDNALESAERACNRELRRLANDQGCDTYVVLAEQSKDKRTIADAYATRAILREFREDLPGALADTDQALAALPFSIFNKRRRASLLGESGDYEEALKLFTDLAAVDPTVSFDENIAMLEYVVGDRARSVALFQSAAVDYAENDHDENAAAIHRFTAAIIESELRGGDPAPIAAQDVSARSATMLPLLKQHRLGELSDADLIARVEKMTGPVARENACDGYFSVGHRNAVAGNAAAAKQAFQSAVDRCSAVTFEYHAAKAWLKQLGG